MIDLRTLDYTGMDFETIGNSLRKTGSLLVVEQAPRSLGLGGRIAAEVQQRFFDYLDGPVGRLSGLDVPNPVSRRLEQAVIHSSAQIKAALLQGARHQY